MTYTLIALKPSSSHSEWDGTRQSYDSDYSVHDNLTREQLVEQAAGYLCRALEEDEAGYHLTFVTIRDGKLASIQGFGERYQSVDSWAQDIHEDTIAKTALFVERRKRDEEEVLALRKAVEKAARDKESKTREAKRVKREKAQLERLKAKYESENRA